MLTRWQEFNPGSGSEWDRTGVFMGILATAVKQTPDMFQFTDRIWELSSLSRVFPSRFGIHDADNQPAAVRSPAIIRTIEPRSGTATAS